MRQLFITIAFLLSGLTHSVAQQSLNNSWQVGLGLGELPIGGSLKPSITLGYHFNEHLYVGVIYQTADKIKRDKSSFNVKASELSQLTQAKEDVAQRLLVQCRYTPVRYAPYISLGFVYNGSDVETMNFAPANRIINGNTYNGDLQITQTRKAGSGLAIGIGYQYNFNNGLSINAEWTPAWFTPIPTPEYSFSGTTILSSQDKQFIKDKMTDGFKSSVTNRYKVFHIGVAYHF
ncbi:MAG: outer membrane beta-barrel protein [Flavipsychrobacter sp.]